MRYSVASLDEEVRRSHLSRYDRVHAFKQAYASEQHPLEELEDTIEAMLNFAFDGYETVNENNEEELVATSIANNAGL